MRLTTAFLIVLVLSGCVRTLPHTEADRHLGTLRHVSESVGQRQLPDAASYVTALMATDGRGEIWGIRINIIREDLNYPRISSVWSDGKRLPYRRLDRNRLGSRRQEVGQIVLDRRDFVEFARNGMQFEAIGTRSTYPFRVPARIFRQVIALAGNSG